jgi:hypothetical protein
MANRARPLAQTAAALASRLERQDGMRAVHTKVAPALGRT